jgi:prevent-host-death family protein
METLNASDAKREFGDLLMKAQREPVGINKNGKPIAVLVSAVEYREIELMKENYLKSAIQEGLADLEAGNVQSGKDVFDELRKRI